MYRPNVNVNVLVFMVEIRDSILVTKYDSCDEITILTLHCTRNYADWFTQRISGRSELEQCLAVGVMFKHCFQCHSDMKRLRFGRNSDNVRRHDHVFFQLN